MTNRMFLNGLLGALLATLTPLAVSAAEPTDYDRIDESQWRYRVTPYLWGAGLEGEVGKFGRRADVSKRL